MRIPLFKRTTITVLNILFPPLAVLMITGPNEDFIFNCVMFILAIIPSHIHGFYISLTYFNRKRKVRKGIYPGKPKHLIWSDKVNNGGASRRELERLKTEKELGRRATRRRGQETDERSGSRQRVHEWDDGYKEYASPSSVSASSPVSPQMMSRVGSRRSGGSGRNGRSGRMNRRERYYDDEYDY